MAGMKSFAKGLLYFLPIGLLFYFKKALVPAVEAKGLAVRGALMVIAVLFAVLYLSDKEFKTEATVRFKALWNQYLGKMFVFSWVILGISTVFAYSPFAAFFGTVTRGEGFIGLTFMYLITFFAAMIFDRSDWPRFWRISAISGSIAFLAAFVRFLGGAYRPGALMDNPIFLAGYFLFTIFAGLMLVTEGHASKKTSIMRAGLGTVGVSIFGILITESRGVILGLVVGAIVALAYLALKKPQISVNQSKKGVSADSSIRKVAIRTLIALALFGGVFIGTRHAGFWQKVPGLGRVAEFSTTDTTTQSRLANVKLTLRAIEPRADNIKNTLVGWGWDNYVFAWQAHYDPNLFAREQAIFDRAHNKLLDVLVMNGVFGLVAYLALWACIIVSSLRIGRRAPLVGASLLAFEVSFFVQNMFVFDTVISYVPFFILVAYLMVENRDSYEK